MPGTSACFSPRYLTGILFLQCANIEIIGTSTVIRVVCVCGRRGGGNYVIREFSGAFRVIIIKYSYFIVFVDSGEADITASI